MIFQKQDLYLTSFFYDDFESFDLDLKRLCQKRGYADVSRRLRNLFQGEDNIIFAPRDIKQFCKQYQYLFNIIQDVQENNYWYRDVYDFLRDNYDVFHEGFSKPGVNAFFRELHRYIQNNQEIIPNMRLLYNKLEDLNISWVYVSNPKGSTSDRTYDSYRMDHWKHRYSWEVKDVDDFFGEWSYHKGDSRYILSQNMEILPGFSKDGVDYCCCDDSNYVIETGEVENRLYLPNLQIDPSILPDDLQRVDKMLEESRPMYNAIRDTAQLAEQREEYKDLIAEYGRLGLQLESKGARGLVDESLGIANQVVDLSKQEQKVWDQRVLDYYPVSRKQLEKEKTFYIKR